MVLYRKKTRDPEKVVDPKDYRVGLIVWVQNGPGPREQHICTDKIGGTLPYADYMRKKEERRQANIRLNPHRTRNRSRPREHPSAPYMGQ